MWLVASSELADLAALRDGKPALWRELRRFNAPIQLAVAAAHEVVAHAAAPAEAAIISLAPCESGSPELHAWVREIVLERTSKINPTHTLHAVDNLALSVLSISLASHAWAMGLGGTMWFAALELVLERDEHEVIVLAGDQLSGAVASPSTGVALLFSRERRPYVATGRPTRLAGIERQRRSPTEITGSATHDAVALLAALRTSTGAIVVPGRDTCDDIAVRWEVD